MCVFYLVLVGYIYIEGDFVIQYSVTIYQQIKWNSFWDIYLYNIMMR